MNSEVHLAVSHFLSKDMGAKRKLLCRCSWHHGLSSKSN